MGVHSIWAGVKEVFGAFFTDWPFTAAAALSFYALLSMAPLLMVLVAVMGAMFGEEAVRGQLSEQIQKQVGPHAGKIIQTILAQAAGPGQGIVLIVGLVMLAFGATSAFVQLQASLNQIWRVRTLPAKNLIMLWLLVRDRLLSLVMVAVIGLLLLISVLLNVAITAVRGFLPPQIAQRWWLWIIANEVVSLIVIAALIAAIYKILPDVRIGWGKAWVGGIFTAILFWIGKYAIGFYLGQTSVGSAYGAASSLVALLVWVYYSSLIVFFGAEITKVYARRTGGEIVPGKHAVRVDEYGSPL